MFRFVPLFLAAGLLALITAVEPVRAVDLFAFREASGRVLAFAVPDTEPIPATVDQTGATQAALDWARRFYRLDDLEILAVEFETRPTRFWRVTFLVSERGQARRLYAVVLPDGRPVEPTVRDERLKLDIGGRWKRESTGPTPSQHGFKAKDHGPYFRACD